MNHANLMTLSSIEPQLRVIDCGNMDCRLFCSCDLDFDPMTFVYELDPYSLKIHWMCKYELPTIKTFESYRLTD